MKKKPHIIIFNPDQYRADALHHLGCEAVVTPNMDKTCTTDGVSFRHAFCQNPVCTPSRCSFMTGWYPHVHGHRTMHHMLREHEPVLLQILKQNGYHVWWGGKNDLVPGQNNPKDYCDELNRTKRKITGYNLHVDDAWRGDPEGDNYFSFYAGRVEPKEGEEYIDNDWAHVLDAIDMIKNYDGDKPLCVYLPLTYPHPPYGVEEPFYSMIDRAKIDEPIKPYENLEDKPCILKGLWDTQRMQNWSVERLVELKATYLGMCARIDKQYGMILDALKKKKMYDDSAVFVLSDHGDFTGDYGLVEKTQNTFQDCLTNVPFIIKPPKGVSVQPRVSDALVELVDFSATVADMTGIELDYTNFGKSLLPVLAGETDEHRDAVFTEGGRMPYEMHCSEFQSSGAKSMKGLYSPRMHQQASDTPAHSKAVMLRTKDYKYVYRVGESDELYDLKNDPKELVNLINHKDWQNVRIALKERMLTFFVETGDVVPYKGDQRHFAR